MPQIHHSHISCEYSFSNGWVKEQDELTSGLWTSIISLIQLVSIIHNWKFTGDKATKIKTKQIYSRLSIYWFFFFGQNDSSIKLRHLIYTFAQQSRTIFRKPISLPINNEKKLSFMQLPSRNFRMVCKYLCFFPIIHKKKLDQRKAYLLGPQGKLFRTDTAIYSIFSFLLQTWVLISKLKRGKEIIFSVIKIIFSRLSYYSNSITEQEKDQQKNISVKGIMGFYHVF